MQYQCFPIPGGNNKMCDHNHQAALFLVISNEGNTSKSGVVSVIEPPSVIVDEAHFVVTYTVGPLHPVTILFVSSQLHPPLHCRPESDPVDRK